MHQPTACLGSDSPGGAPLEDGPAWGEGEVGAGEEVLAVGLDLGDEFAFVDEEGGVVFDDDFSVDDDGVDAAAVGVVDEGVDGVVEGAPLGAPGVEEDEVGLLSHFD